jgi:hypothetical protein
MGLEGIVSKRLTSRYKSGACKSWLKVKNPAYQRRRARNKKPGATAGLSRRSLVAGEPLADADRLPNDIAVDVVNLLLAQAGIGIAIRARCCGTKRRSAQYAKTNRRTPASSATIGIAAAVARGDDYRARPRSTIAVAAPLRFRPLRGERAEQQHGRSQEH